MKNTLVKIKLTSYIENESCSIVSDSLWPHGLYSPRNSPGQNTGRSSRSPLQGIFPTQGLNPGLPHCRQILYQLSHMIQEEFYNWLFKKTGEGDGDPLQYSRLENPMDGGAWWAAVHGVAKSRTRPSNFTFTFHFHALEKEMATHSSVLAWRIPGMGEPGGLPSMGSHRVGHDWSDLAAAAAFKKTNKRQLGKIYE